MSTNPAFPYSVEKRPYFVSTKLPLQLHYSNPFRKFTYFLPITSIPILPIFNCSMQACTGNSRIFSQSQAFLFFRSSIAVCKPVQAIHEFPPNHKHSYSFHLQLQYASLYRQFTNFLPITSILILPIFNCSMQACTGNSRISSQSQAFLFFRSSIAVCKPVQAIHEFSPNHKHSYSSDLQLQYASLYRKFTYFLPITSIPILPIFNCSMQACTGNSRISSPMNKLNFINFSSHKLNSLIFVVY